MPTRSMVRPESEQKVAAMFDRIAPRYDLLNILLSAGQDRRWRKHMCKALPAGKNASILDVATGTGDVLIAAIKARPQLGRCSGVDISAEMLNLAEQKLAGFSGKERQIELGKMSAENLLFESETFDALTISFGLRNVVDKEKAIQEFRRVLKEKGRLLILEFFPSDSGALSGLFQFYFKNILPKIGGLISDRSAYQYLPESVNSFHSAAEMKLMLQRLGFNSVKEKKFLWGACRLIQADL